MLKGKKVVDLTLELYNGMQSWNIHPNVVLMDYHQWWLNKDRYEGEANGFSTKLMVMTDHTGTHVDAQRHFYPNGKSIVEYPPTKFMGEAVYLDVTFKELDAPITVEDLNKALQDSGESLQDNDILVVKAWPESREHESFFTSPGLTPQATQWLIDKNIKLFATDLPTVDNQDMSRTAHVKLLGNDILIAENLVNLDSISQNRFYFMGVPFKMKEGTGSPIRALAIIDDK